VSECFYSRGRTEMAADVGGGNSRLDGNHAGRNLSFNSKLKGERMTWVGGVDEWLLSEGSALVQAWKEGVSAWEAVALGGGSGWEPGGIAVFQLILRLLSVNGERTTSKWERREWMKRLQYSIGVQY
jgi:hypothetical protein